MTQDVTAGHDGRVRLELTRRAMDVLDSAGTETLALHPRLLVGATGGTPEDFSVLRDALDLAADTATRTHATLVVAAGLVPILRALMPAVTDLIDDWELPLRTSFDPGDFVAAQNELLAALGPGGRLEP